MEIRIVEVQLQMVLGMRKEGKYDEIGMMISKIWQFGKDAFAQILPLSSP